MRLRMHGFDFSFLVWPWLQLAVLNPSHECRPFACHGMKARLTELHLVLLTTTRINAYVSEFLYAGLIRVNIELGALYSLW